MMLTEQPVGRRRPRAVVRASRGFRDECRGLLVTTVPPPLPSPPDVGVSYTHLRTDTQILVFPHADALVLACVCVRERAAAKQSPAVCCSRALEADLPQCLHCLRRKRGCREGDVAPCEGEMWPSTESRRTHRCGSWRPGPSLVGLMQ